MTEMEMKVKMPTKDVKVATEKLETRSTATSALILPLNKVLPPGSPLSTPEIEQRPPLSLNLCDKCDKDIHQVAAFVAGKKGGTIELNSKKSNEPEEMD